MLVDTILVLHQSLARGAQKGDLRFSYSKQSLSNLTLAIRGSDLILSRKIWQSVEAYHQLDVH